MILQALNKYYGRLQEEVLDNVATEGFQKQAIPFVVVLDQDGRFVELLDTRSGECKKKTAREFTVPKGVKKTCGIAANLLWDSPAYVLGRSKPNPKKDPAGVAAKAVEQQLCFIDNIRNALVSAHDDVGVNAVLRFLESGEFQAVFAHPFWSDIEKTAPNLSFQLAGDSCLVCERPAVIAALTEKGKDASMSGNQQTCLVTGESDEPTRLHTSIKGVWGAQTSGANIVSFNRPAFTSYGKKQSFNAPVGKCAEFAYTTALNHLLRKGSKQRIQVGDASTVFWTEKEHEIENVFADLFGEPAKDESQQDYKQLVATFRSPEKGSPPQLDPQTRFFVLGLAPNAARIAIRFWHAGTVGQVAGKDRKSVV